MEKLKPDQSIGVVQADYKASFNIVLSVISQSTIIPKKTGGAFRQNA